MNQRGRTFVRAAALTGIAGVLAAWAATSVTVSDATATVTGSSASTLNFPVSRAGDTGFDAYVSYQTVDGTAVAPTNYTAASGTLKIPAGSSSGTIPVTIAGSTTQQADRSFTLSLTPLTGIGPAPTFSAAQSVSGGNPWSIAAADFNLDGLPDVAVTNINPNTVSVSLDATTPGSATSSFATAVTLAVGGHPDGIAAADLNGDGKPDLVVSDNTSTNISALVNTTTPGATTPSFATPQTFSNDGSPGAVAIADVNGDGKPDVLEVDTGPAKVSVFINTTTPGSATLALTRTPIVFGNFLSGIAVADFNGDGRPDMAVTSLGDTKLYVALNTTALGAATPAFTTQSLSIGQPTQVAAGDFNADGRPDLVLNNGIVLVNTTSPGASSATFSVQAQAQVFGSVTADLNGDGRPDVVGAGGKVYLNLTPAGASSATFAAAVTFGATGQEVAIADINKDGKPDIVQTFNNGSTFATYLNTTALPSPSLDLTGEFSSSAGSQPDGVAAADLNLDGKVDLVTANVATNDLSALLNATPAGGSTPAFAAPQAFAAGSGAAQVAARDLNADGKADVVVANESANTLSVLINATTPGSASAAFATAQTLTVGSAPYGLALGDLTGDGLPDLVAANSGGTGVSVIVNATTPGATPAFRSAQSFATGSGPVNAAIGDLNGDGVPDVVAACWTDSVVSILLNTTAPGALSAGFATQQSFATGRNPRGVAIADFNDDGRPDLAVPDHGDDTVSVLLNTTAAGAATMTFATRQTFAAGSGPVALASADLNGDGRPDLLVVDHGTDSVTALLNTTAPGASTASFSAPLISAVGPGTFGLASADLNGDGQPDAIATNSDGGTASVLLNQHYAVNSNASATGTIHYAVPVPDASPSSLSFGYILVGATSATKTVTVTNGGAGTLTVSGVTVSGTHEFAVTSNGCSGVGLASGASCPIDVDFAPVANANRVATLVISTNNGQKSVTLTASGATNNGTLAFGDQTVNTMSVAGTVTFTNVGSTSYGVGPVGLYGDDPGDFMVTSNSCSGTLAPGQSCVVYVLFRPTTTGARSALLVVPSGAPSSPDAFTLTGTGIAPASGGGGGAFDWSAVALMLLARRIRASPLRGPSRAA